MEPAKIHRSPVPPLPANVFRFSPVLTWKTHESASCRTELAMVWASRGPKRDSTWITRTNSYSSLQWEVESKVSADCYPHFALFVHRCSWVVLFAPKKKLEIWARKEKVFRVHNCTSSTGTRDAALVTCPEVIKRLKYFPEQNASQNLSPEGVSPDG